MNIFEVEGDLIEMALEGRFDVIAHGCNCMCAMKRGLAPKMVEAFGCNKFPLEHNQYRGDINKLGQIDFKHFYLDNGELHETINKIPIGFLEGTINFAVVNCYTQYNYSNSEDPKPLDMMALALCLKKMNHVFKGKHIGLPRIGAGLAGGRWDQILPLIKISLTDCGVTIVSLKQ